MWALAILAGAVSFAIGYVACWFTKESIKQTYQSDLAAFKAERDEALEKIEAMKARAGEAVDAAKKVL
jgi:uncharacterized membrane-anchored protein YhcB (DUF1043 family)